MRNSVSEACASARASHRRQRPALVPGGGEPVSGGSCRKLTMRLAPSSSRCRHRRSAAPGKAAPSFRSPRRSSRPQHPGASNSNSSYPGVSGLLVCGRQCAGIGSSPALMMSAAVPCKGQRSRRVPHGCYAFADSCPAMPGTWQRRPNSVVTHSRGRRSVHPCKSGCQDSARNRPRYRPWVLFRGMPELCREA